MELDLLATGCLDIHAYKIRFDLYTGLEIICFERTNSFRRNAAKILPQFTHSSNKVFLNILNEEKLLRSVASSSLAERFGFENRHIRKKKLPIDLWQV